MVWFVFEHWNQLKTICYSEDAHCGEHAIWSTHFILVLVQP